MLQKYAVCLIMFQMHLGPVNLSVLGATVVGFAVDNLDYVVTHPALLTGLISQYDSADKFFIQALYEFIKVDDTAKVCVADPEKLIRQLRRCLTRLIHDNRAKCDDRDDGGGGNKEITAKVCMVLETVRRLMDVTSFFTAVERSCTQATVPESNSTPTQPKAQSQEARALIEVWLHCCQEFASSRIVVLNCARVLSISPQSEIICAQFRQPATALVMAQSMESFINDTDILVRYLYALGNCLAADQRCRQLNTRLPRSIRRILSHYYKKTDSQSTNQKVENAQNSPQGAKAANCSISKENADVMLKVIRLIANFSLEKVGAQAVLEESAIIKILLKLLTLSERRGGKQGAIAEEEEIARSCLASLNNLIYFSKEQFVPFIDDCADAFITVSGGPLVPIHYTNSLKFRP